MSDTAETSDSSSCESSAEEDDSCTETSTASSPEKSSPGKENAITAKAIKPAGRAVRPSAATSAHPATAVMVMTAVTELKDRKGTSLVAIKKYVSANYDVNSNAIAPYIRKFLVSAADDGRLIRTKGMGANGSFKLPADAKKKKVVKKKTDAKKATAAKDTAAVKPKKKPKSDDPAAKKTKKAVESKPKAKKSPSKKPAEAKAIAKKSPVKKQIAAKEKAKKSPVKKAQDTKKIWRI